MFNKLWRSDAHQAAVCPAPSAAEVRRAGVARAAGCTAPGPASDGGAGAATRRRWPDTEAWGVSHTTPAAAPRQAVETLRGWALVQIKGALEKRGRVEGQPA